MSEQSDTNAAEALRWLAQAEEEFRAAERIASDADLPVRIACFLAHLAAEKALKACLINLGVAFTKVHDLADLRALLSIGDVALDDGDLALLNPWAIAGRYPGDMIDATRAEADECLRAAGHVVAKARTLMEAPSS